MRAPLPHAVAAAVAALLLAVPLAAPAAHASHADGSYDQGVWFEWARRTIEVLVLPPGHGQLYNSANGPLGGLSPAEATPHANSYVNATLDSIQMWRDAIDAFGPSWLSANLVITVAVAGVDRAPVNPEIVIVFDETKGSMLGVAFSGTPCIVDNSKMMVQSFTYEDMFNVNGHEFGHCLGLEHTSGDHPTHDLLNAYYEHRPGAAGNPRKCVSNLNVETLEGVFAGAMRQPRELWGRDGSVRVSEYAQVAC